MSRSPLVPSPKRPGREHPFVPLSRPVTEQPPDYYALFSLFCGMLAVATRLRFYTWLTLLCFLASLANTRHSEADFKQILASCTLVVLTFTSTYLQPGIRPFFLPRLN